MDDSIERPERVKPVWCPLSRCGAKFGHRESTVDRITKDLQNHLWIHHGIEVMKSHEMARLAVAKAQSEDMHG